MLSFVVSLPAPGTPLGEPDQDYRDNKQRTEKR